MPFRRARQWSYRKTGSILITGIKRRCCRLFMMKRSESRRWEIRRCGKTETAIIWWWEVRIMTPEEFSFIRVKTEKTGLTQISAGQNHTDGRSSVRICFLRMISGFSSAVRCVWHQGRRNIRTRLYGRWRNLIRRPVNWSCRILTVMWITVWICMHRRRHWMRREEEWWSPGCVCRWQWQTVRIARHGTVWWVVPAWWKKKRDICISTCIHRWTHTSARKLQPKRQQRVEKSSGSGRIFLREKP